MNTEPPVEGTGPTDGRTHSPPDLDPLRLDVIAGRAAGTEIQVGDELIIGRHALGDGQLSDDHEISRQHARLSRESEGNYAIEDLGSSNGTFVNGLRIDSPRLLELGDSIEVGATTLVVGYLPSMPPPAAPPGLGSQRPAGAVISHPQTAAEPDPQTAAEPVTPSPPGPEPTEAQPPVPADLELAPGAGTPDRRLIPGSQAAAPELGPTAGPQAAVPLLRLEVDFDLRQARVAWGDGHEAVRLVFRDGAWQVAVRQ